MANDASLVYTPAELQKLLKRGRSSIYMDLAAGRIPSIRIGGRVLIPKTAIDNLLAGAQARTP